MTSYLGKGQYNLKRDRIRVHASDPNGQWSMNLKRDKKWNEMNQVMKNKQGNIAKAKGILNKVIINKGNEYPIKRIEYLYLLAQQETPKDQDGKNEGTSQQASKIYKGNYNYLSNHIQRFNIIL